MDKQRLTFSIEGHFLEVVMSIVFTYILLANKLVQRRLEIYSSLCMTMSHENLGQERSTKLENTSSFCLYASGDAGKKSKERKS